MFKLFALVFVFHAAFCQIDEPRCGKYEYEEKLLYKLIKIEEEVKRFRIFVDDLRKRQEENEQNQKQTFDSVLETFKKKTVQQMEEAKGNLEQLQQEFNKSLELFMEASAKALYSPVVGFTVKSHKDSPTSGQLTFTDVVTNVGDGFDTATGVFKCTVPGHYVFTVSLLQEYSYTSYSYCWIYKNDKDLVFAHVYPGRSSGNGRFPAVTSVFVHLSAGDTVRLAGCSSASAFDSQSSFTGFLVTPDND